MPVFVIERRYAEQLDLRADELRELTEITEITEITDDEVRWLYSSLSVDGPEGHGSAPLPAVDRGLGPVLADVRAGWRRS